MCTSSQCRRRRGSHLVAASNRSYSAVAIFWILYCWCWERAKLQSCTANSSEWGDLGHLRLWVHMVEAVDGLNQLRPCLHASCLFWRHWVVWCSVRLGLNRLRRYCRARKDSQDCCGSLFGKFYLIPTWSERRWFWQNFRLPSCSKLCQSCRLGTRSRHAECSSP